MKNTRNKGADSTPRTINTITDTRKLTDILSVISEIENEATADGAFERFRRYARQLGGNAVLIGQIVNPVVRGKKIAAFGRADWPEEWRNKWIEENYVLHDPISRYALKTRSAFNWSTAYSHATKFGRKIFDEGKTFQLGAGIAIPITVGHLPMGIASVSYEEENLPPEDLARLELVAIHTYSRLLRLLDIDEPVQIPQLTKREIDILNYVAAGKTNWEISRIYSLSEHSVAQHVKNAGRKLNASNRTHSVTLAIQSGHIIP